MSSTNSYDTKSSKIALSISYAIFNGMYRIQSPIYRLKQWSFMDDMIRLGL